LKKWLLNSFCCVQSLLVSKEFLSNKLPFQQTKKRAVLKMIFTDFIFYVLVKFVQLSLVFIKGNLT